MEKNMENEMKSNFLKATIFLRISHMHIRSPQTRDHRAEGLTNSLGSRQDVMGHSRKNASHYAP